jgi:tetratricopeptide (TPR) repeat protein
MFPQSGSEPMRHWFLKFRTSISHRVKICGHDKLIIDTRSRADLDCLNCPASHWFNPQCRARETEWLAAGCFSVRAEVQPVIEKIDSATDGTESEKNKARFPFLTSMIRSLARASLFLLLATVCGSAQDLAKASLSDSLKSVEDLYYTAKFGDAANLLDEIDLQLASARANVEDLKKVKLYQALVDIALDYSDEAKIKFQELLALDPAFSLDNTEHAPKIIEIFTDARKGWVENQCKKACTECEAQRKDGDLQKAVDTIKPVRLECECAKQITGPLASALIERGLSALRVGDYARGLKDFRRALDVDPDNQVASESSILASNQLQASIATTEAEWRKYFDARNYASARDAYDRIVRLSPDGESSAPDQIRTEYKNVLNRDRLLWAAACARPDPVLTDSLRQEVRSLDPKGEFNAETLANIQSCPVMNCTALPSASVLERRRSGPYPKIDPALRASTSKIAVKIRIDDRGRVTVVDIDNPAGNSVVTESVRDAVQQWKFDSGLASRSAGQCVLTDFLLEFEK